MKIFRKSFLLNGAEIIIESGLIARRASGSVTVQMGKTIVVAAAEFRIDNQVKKSFLPLMVTYQERAYAAGRIPGSFFRREGRLSESEIITSRLIDRSLRPLFPKTFFNDVQITVTTLSFDANFPPDILAIIASSSALLLAGLPIKSTVAAVRVGFVSGEYILNPSLDQIKTSDLSLVVTGTNSDVVMVEAESNNLPEEVILGAIIYGHKKLQIIIDSINQLSSAALSTSVNFDNVPSDDLCVIEEIKSKFWEIFNASKTDTTLTDGEEYFKTIAQTKKQLVADLTREKYISDVASLDTVKSTLSDIERHCIRQNILKGLTRIDGRSTRSVRPIDIRVGVLPRSHGSALFTRGETQALVSTVLASDRDAQLLETLDDGDFKNRFLLHYNFPPYSVGEVGFKGFTSRREIGHGNLAKLAMKSVFPNEDHYPYVIRVTSEIMGSNGSSSMATVCGASLSMMDAGVPIAAPVAGIAMGLVKEGSKFAVLSDISGEEDRLGDMDFKVAGTIYGVTALQMDIKTIGITYDIISASLSQAKEGRLHIIDIMNSVINRHRLNVSEDAPQAHIMSIHSNKIRDLIGKGGSVIKGIIRKTSSSIDVGNNGEIKIFAKNKDGLDSVINEIKLAIADVEVGNVYDGKIVKVLDYGVFVNILPGKDGFLSLSDVDSMGIDARAFCEGKVMKTRIHSIDRSGKIRLLPL